jgi:hypothetical protein
MTPEQRKLTHDLIITPPSGTRRISLEEFLRRFPSSVVDGKLASGLLEEAWRTKNSDDLQSVLMIGHTFGFGPDQIAILCRLLEENWHFDHENIVSALDKFRSPRAVDALFHATQWIPDYLEYDETRALAVKAIFALAKIPGVESQSKLEVLAGSHDEILQKRAKHLLAHRDSFM